MRKGVTALVAFALLTSACGNQTAPVTSEPPSVELPEAVSESPSSPEVKATAQSIVPAVTVVNLANDADFQLASLIPAERPVLLWFWAPH